MTEPQSSVVLRGGCFCGGVQYTSTALPSDIQNCHCSMCRRLSGAPFLAFADFPLDAVTFDPKGSLQILYLSGVAERGYCSACGTPVTMTYKCQPDMMGIAAGTIDEDSVEGELTKATAHIFLEQKASWYTLGDDGLQRWDRFGDDFQLKIDEWEKETLKKGQE
ncbi:hypothetical protein MMC07_005827 [Pseudocyphellaria aurata]|nr:hypothetical protein [Pseudocyphellaria aurata]